MLFSEPMFQSFRQNLEHPTRFGAGGYLKSYDFHL
jgi:hypothetical protein